MYPFKGEQNFPRNQWYVAAWSSEVNRDLMERWLLDEPVVFYRTQDGQPIALSNRCIHRRYPLSKGKLVGDNLECGYHGFTYDCSGTCIKVPSQEQIPVKAHVRNYPLIEKWELIWIWMGDPERADPALLPDHHRLKLDDPNWVTFAGGMFPIKGRYQLLNENLLDLSHLNFLHPSNLGTASVTATFPETEVTNGTVRVSRRLNNEQPPPLYVKAMNLQSLINRIQVSEFTPPGFHCTHVEGRLVGQDEMIPFEHNVMHIVTPSTSHSTFYFWAVARNYATTPEVSAFLKQAFTGVFVQDVEALELQEQMIATDDPNAQELYVKADAGALKARQLVEQQIQAESLVYA